MRRHGSGYERGEPQRKKQHMLNLIFFAVTAVPDAGTTLSLFGIALASLVIVRAKLK
jgi:protein with PEP-CTERM/exosortase system signal